MRHCPNTRTAESLTKHLGSDNVWSVYFAVSEISRFAQQISGTGFAHDRVRRAATVSPFPFAVQRQLQSAPSHPKQPDRHGHVAHLLNHSRTSFHLEQAK